MNNTILKDISKARCSIWNANGKAPDTVVLGTTERKLLEHKLREFGEHQPYGTDEDHVYAMKIIPVPVDHMLVVGYEGELTL